MKAILRLTLGMLMAGAALCAPVAAADDAALIRASIRATWEQPAAPLAVDPVVVSGSHAVAGWVQGERGGRALLARRQGRWVVVACGGDGLRDAALLEQAGIPGAAATTLVEGLKSAESKLPDTILKKFASFGGLHIMLMDLKQPLKKGDKFPLTLEFEKAGRVNVEVQVEEVASSAVKPAAGHSH